MFRIFIPLLLLVQFASAQKLKKADKEIVQYLQNQVGYLSSDELKGRRAGDPGEILAAEFIAAKFEEIGLIPKGDNSSYFQHFTINDGKELSKDNAFKVNGKQVEVCRTSHMKSHKDLISCTKISEDTDICFLDDKFHPGMSNDKIYYINIKPYIHDLSFDEMIERFEKSDIISSHDIININQEKSFKPFMLNFFKRYHYTFAKKTKEAQNVDKILSKQIMHHLHIFFDKFGTKPKANTKKIF